MLFATPDDVVVTQADVKAQVKAISDALGECVKAGVFSFSKGTESDPSIGRDWKAVLKRTVSYLAEEPSWIDAQTQQERGVRILSELQPWYERVDKAGCHAPPKPAPPANKPKAEEWAGDWAMLVGLAIVAFALHEVKGI